MGGGHRLHRARLVHQQRCKVVSCGGHPGVDHDEPSAVSGDHVAVETPPRNPGDPQSWNSSTTMPVGPPLAPHQ